MQYGCSLEQLCLFCFVFSFRESRTEPFQDIKKFYFQLASVLSWVWRYVCLLSASRLFAVWSKARAQSNVMSRCCFLVSLVPIRLVWLYNILDPHENSRSHTSVGRRHIEHGNVYLQQATDAIYVALPLGNNMHPVHFRKHMVSLLCQPTTYSAFPPGPLNTAYVWQQVPFLLCHLYVKGFF